MSLSIDSLHQHLLAPQRRITGISAILLPFNADGDIDWAGFDDHVQRTVDAGLQPAVNMDTGYGHLLNAPTKEKVLRRTAAIAGNDGFVAGAFVGDREGASFQIDEYARAMEPIQQFGGTPVIFQSYGLTGQSGEDIVDSYRQIGTCCDRFIAFELGEMFAPFGKIYSLSTYEQLLSVEACMGAKHSSLDRELEWRRLEIRNRVRPEFRVFTGNDLAIDMVMYGSDYLLGLSTFAPEEFALRDKYWELGDPRFFELNDTLQYLGFLAFRPPVPAYKHSAAMFLRIREWIATNRTHPQSPERPASDIETLEKIYERLQELSG